jgi:hypothetical protein
MFVLGRKIPIEFVATSQGETKSEVCVFGKRIPEVEAISGMVGSPSYNS